MNDLIATAISFGYVAIIVGVAETLRRSGRVPFHISRKIIHVGIGSWIVPTVLLYQSAWWAAFPPALFVGLNLLSLRSKWVKAMDEEAGDNLGTVLFPLAFVILISIFWNLEDGKRAIAGGILVLAWGDAAAALVGQRWGSHRYAVGAGWRSWEGSAAMFAFSAFALAAVGAIVGPALAAGLLFLGAVVATGLEAGSRWGLDNLLVPLGTAFLLWGLG